MFSHYVLSIMFMFSIIVLAEMLSSGSTWDFENDDIPLSNPGLSLDSALTSFNQPFLSLDSDSDSIASLFGTAELPDDFLDSSTSNNVDTSDADIWDIHSDIPTFIEPDDDNNNNSPPNFSSAEDFFQLADCSTSESLEMIFGKSKIRRENDDSSKCTNPAIIPTIPHLNSQPTPLSEDDLKQLGELLSNPEMLPMAVRARENPESNVACFVLTGGLYPWGVCSSGREEDQTQWPGRLMVDGWIRLNLWQLNQCTLGTSLRQTLRIPPIFILLHC